MNNTNHYQAELALYNPQLLNIAKYPSITDLISSSNDQYQPLLGIIVLIHFTTNQY